MHLFFDASRNLFLQPSCPVCMQQYNYNQILPVPRYLPAEAIKGKKPNKSKMIFDISDTCSKVDYGYLGKHPSWIFLLWITPPPIGKFLSQSIGTSRHRLPSYRPWIPFL